MAKERILEVSRDRVIRLWLHRQGLLMPRGSSRSARESLTDHLERTGGLQLDTINVLDRAHYLTLWSRWGRYDKSELDAWVYADQLAYEYWGHEASILPITNLPIGRRRMRRWPPESVTSKSWWPVYQTSATSKRRVLRRLRNEGPLESADFEKCPDEFGSDGPPGGAMPISKEDTRSLKLLWHAGRVAVRNRRHFRCIYDLAENVYPEGRTASTTEFEDSWLLQGISGNGVANERHLINYMTAPNPKAPDRKRIIARNLKKHTIVQVRVEGQKGLFYTRPDFLDILPDLPEATGTTILCPFDSLLWQRSRAEDLLGFRYRIEIYTPAAKREYGYYVMPILHNGKLVGRLDPKLHRDKGRLQIKAIYLEEGFRPDRRFERGVANSLSDLAEFVGAESIELPEGWRIL